MISIADARSQEHHRRALSRIPGGVNSPVRAMTAVGREHPLFIERGSGAVIHDIDGNPFIDYVCSWGPLIAGHAHPDVVEAITERARLGTTFGAPTQLEVELAEEVSRRMPSVEMMRMTSSGTEAAMSAVRLARAATGRSKILKFAGAYHGHIDGLLAEAGSGLATGAIASSPGVLQTAADETVVVAWNDGEAVAAACAEHDGAAVIAEPYAANMGLMPPVEGFLELLRNKADENGALLIFDEVITGFRVAEGGAQGRTGVEPDLTVLGKILGGGLPAAAFGGSTALMERIAPAGDVYQAGTLSGNPVATAAGLATLALLDAAAYARLASATEQLTSGLELAAAEAGVPVVVHSVPGLLTVFFTESPPRDYAGARGCDLDAFAAFHGGLLARGVYVPPSQFEAWFPSIVHGPEQIEQTIEAAVAAFADIAR